MCSAAVDDQPVATKHFTSFPQNHYTNITGTKQTDTLQSWAQRS
jgi:hypothetical protein